MKTYRLPKKSTWQKLSTRPSLEQRDLFSLVQNIYAEVASEGDEALKRYSKKFDQCDLKKISVKVKSIESAAKGIDPKLIKAIGVAKKNITKFHASQKQDSIWIETTPGVKCMRKSTSIERVGIYIPGGTAPLFSTLLMLGIPAKIAGCSEIELCTPPDSAGAVHPVIMYVAALLGIKKINLVGGAQAIAAMSIGTKSVSKVHKIFGPGNQYVTAAKQYAQYLGVAIDMPAGPSEVLIIADKNAEPAFVAADLLSQAEHGIDSQVILLSNDEATIKNTLQSISDQLEKLPRKNLAQATLQNSKAILLETIDDCLAFNNIYAPEHLILAVKNANQYINKVSSAGSVFLGNYTCESAGDYASGTNHTLPTNGYANAYSGVSLDSFLKKITFQEISPSGIQKLGPSIVAMAEAESLQAHAEAVRVRIKSLKKN
jgi:histidinol dehydrogenase